MLNIECNLLKKEISQIIVAAVQDLIADGTLEAEFNGSVQVNRTKDPAHGDYASNIALMFAKQLHKAPRELAEILSTTMQSSPLFEKVEVAGPGFINFFLARASHAPLIKQILAESNLYGCNKSGQDKSIHIEYVSANPTGPLHVGHGRGAAYGATLANLYAANGYQVHREYYVNDAGRQMDILATSVWLRYLELCGAEFTFPSNGYQGDYIWDIAATAQRNYENTYFMDPASFTAQYLPTNPKASFLAK